MKLKWMMGGLVVLWSGIALGNRNYGMAGCGGGSIIMGSEAGGQISAATSNATSYQSFAISTGTSNCVPDTKMSRAERAFINHNFVSFEKDVARGGGETIVALSSLLGCHKNAVDKVSKVLQSSYAEIFREPGAIASLLEAKNKLRQIEELTRTCVNLS